ncbi:MAG: cytochrome c, partial [Polyangiaceae bacterium]|nr:cytochrome c [Polyangiaceae bacterium]
QGCDGGTPTRTWEPDDHSHPAGRVDPSRLVAPAETPSVGTARDRALAALYQAHCASCHGASGRGDGPDRSPMMQVPDFTSAEWQQSRDDQTLASVVKQGRGLMPAFGDRIADENIVGLVQRVRAFAAPAAEAQRPPKPLLPTTPRRTDLGP